MPRGEQERVPLLIPRGTRVEPIVFGEVDSTSHMLTRAREAYRVADGEFSAGTILNENNGVQLYWWTKSPRGEVTMYVTVAGTVPEGVQAVRGNFYPRTYQYTPAGFKEVAAYDFSVKQHGFVTLFPAEGGLRISDEITDAYFVMPKDVNLEQAMRDRNLHTVEI